MSLFDLIRTELVDIVEWVDDSQHTLVWRFPRYHNQIKNGAHLIVRPGQVAVFVHRGEIGDVFEPGDYVLKTDNLPILSTLQGWKHGFDSPFKAEVYFVSTRTLTGMKWGTPNPVMFRDPDFGPIRLQAFGTYALRTTDAKALLKGLVGTQAEFETEEVAELLRSLICSAFAQALGDAKVGALDLASSYPALAERIRTAVVQQIDDEYGLDLAHLSIVSISFPPEVEKALDTRTSMGVIGDLASFQQYQMGQALLAAAQNPGAGGLAAAGAGLGLGVAMLGRVVGPPGPAAPAPGPPPPPPPAEWHVSVGGQTQGPLGLASLVTAIRQGAVGAATLVWTPGLPQWTPAGQVAALAAYFAGAHAPPPLPPAPPK